MADIQHIIYHVNEHIINHAPQANNTGDVVILIRAWQHNNASETLESS